MMTSEWTTPGTGRRPHTPSEGPVVNSTQSIESLKQELAQSVIDQGVHWRILFLGRSINGTTDIVASLSRSLRNLGHHVLDLDTKLHKITENPTRATGGLGPIYVRADKLDAIVENFRPQMIICCAGGLTFTEEDAARLKAQGIVLVGLTLSDPDVYPSVHEHVHVFDVHTTNAELSLDMYERDGVRNTVLFPFAIDRGFVTQPVRSAPELATDVICMGHANNRPDRNEVMRSLAEQFDVRTYGRGWELPGSHTVAGDRALQALKMGRIHVNFPLTRAGFVNIKCGVFESIGAGAVIVTQKFDELARLFDYGDEIVGYDDVDELHDRIAELLDDPEEYERVRLLGFRRLINQHLYEHRWMALFELLRGASADTTPWLGTERSAEVREILSESLPRARRVLLSGFYGAGNLGDELILRSISSALRAADPAADVVVAAENPRAVEIQHGLQAFKRIDIAAGAHQLQSADAVVVGGGGLWHDLTFQRAGGLASLVNGATMSIAGFGNLPMMGRVLGVPYHVIGIGAGPLTDRNAKAMVRHLADQTESLLVRDSESVAVLEDAGVDPDRIRSAPDVVYAVSLPEPAAEPSPFAAGLRELRADGHAIVAVNLRQWAHADMATVVGRVQQAINTIAAGRRVAVVGIPMQGGASHDSSILKTLEEGLSPHIPFHLLPDPPTFGAFTEAMEQADALVTMRLHAALLAHRMHVPTVGLVYDPKVRRHFDEVARSAWALSLEASWDSIHASLEAALAEGRITAADTVGAVTHLERTASAALREAAARVLSAPVRDVVHTVPPEKPAPAAGAPGKTASATAAFIPATYSSSAVDLPQRALGVLFDAPRALHVSLPTTAPTRGMQVVNASALRLDTMDPVEVSLTLTSNYERHQNRKRVRIRVQIGDRVFEDDLARSKEPVLIRVRTAGLKELPVTLSVVVDRECYPATSWPRLSRVGLRVDGVRAVEDKGPVPLVFASAGSVQRVDA